MRFHRMLLLRSHTDIQMIASIIVSLSHTRGVDCLLVLLLDSTTFYEALVFL
jgi:hypothetical protein